jgi:hypothetical protein
MFSPATPSANLSITTPMTKDIKEQQPSTDDKVLEAAILVVFDHWGSEKWAVHFLGFLSDLHRSKL